jgi:hypothetical protein
MNERSFISSKTPAFSEFQAPNADAMACQDTQPFTNARLAVRSSCLFLLVFQHDVGFTERQFCQGIHIKPKEPIMKKIILASIIALSAGTAAFATGGVSTAIAVEVNRLVPGADLTNLTPSQASRLHTLFSKAENLNSSENPVNQIQVILGVQ